MPGKLAQSRKADKQRREDEAPLRCLLTQLVSTQVTWGRLSCRLTHGLQGSLGCDGPGTLGDKSLTAALKGLASLPPHPAGGWLSSAPGEADTSSFCPFGHSSRL